MYGESLSRLEEPAECSGPQPPEPCRGLHRTAPPSLSHAMDPAAGSAPGEAPQSIRCTALRQRPPQHRTAGQEDSISDNNGYLQCHVNDINYPCTRSCYRSEPERERQTLQRPSTFLVAHSAHPLQCSGLADYKLIPNVYIPPHQRAEARCPAEYYPQSYWLTHQ